MYTVQPRGARLALGHLPVSPSLPSLLSSDPGSEVAQLGLVEVLCSLLCSRLHHTPLSSVLAMTQGCLALESLLKKGHRSHLEVMSWPLYFSLVLVFYSNVTHDYKGRSFLQNPSVVLQSSWVGGPDKAWLDSLLGETQSLNGDVSLGCGPIWSATREGPTSSWLLQLLEVHVTKGSFSCWLSAPPQMRVCSAAQCCLLCNPMHCSLPSLLSVGFPKQEYWSRLPFPPPGDLPDQGSNLYILHWQADSLSLSLREAKRLLQIVAHKTGCLCLQSQPVGVFSRQAWQCYNVTIIKIVVT